MILSPDINIQTYLLTYLIGTLVINGWAVTFDTVTHIGLDGMLAMKIFIHRCIPNMASQLARNSRRYRERQEGIHMSQLPRR